MDKHTDGVSYSDMTDSVNCIDSVSYADSGSLYLSLKPKFKTLVWNQSINLMAKS